MSTEKKKRPGPTLEEKRAMLSRALRKKAARPRRFPLSYPQQRLWFLDQMEPGNPAYNVGMAVRLTGGLDARVFEASLTEIVRRHQTLRTRFEVVDGEPVQVVEPRPSFRVPLVDLSRLGAAARQREAERQADRVVNRSFDLSRGALFRATLLRLQPTESVAALAMHHIVSDAWSLGVLIREFGAIYQAFLHGEPTPFPRLPIDFSDYVKWHRRLLRGEVLQSELDYWRTRLAGEVPVLELPTDRPRPAVQTYRGSALELGLSARLVALVEGLRRQKSGVTVFMIVLAAFHTLLSRYSGQSDLVIGTPVTGRSDPRTAPLIGFFVNTLALRVDASGLGRAGFSQLLELVRKETTGALAHQELPFDKLVEELQPVRDTSRTPLFQALLAVQNVPLEIPVVSGLEITRFATEIRAAKFDLSLYLTERPGELEGHLEFNCELFDRTTIGRFLRHFVTFMSAVTSDPDQAISSVPLLDAGERHQVLVEWNATAATRPDLLLQGRFEEHAARKGEAIALSCEDGFVSYAAFDRRANRLAQALLARGLTPDSPVAIAMDRSLEMVVGLYGVLKAGGAYVPLDPSYPKKRLSFMTDDALSAARTPIVLTREDVGAAFGSEERPDSEIGPDHLAYVIYTSGSTGRPKGVMITHRAICNRLLWMQEAYGLTAEDRVLQKTPVSFDVSVWELFWPLMVGAQLVVARPEGHKDTDYLVDLIENRRITTLHFVPSMLQAFVEEVPEGSCRSLKRLVASGEALTASLASRCRGRLDARLENLYGPTEAAVDVSFHSVAKDASPPVPIGRPIANVGLFIVSPDLSPVPMGVAAQLGIAGTGLARGYLARPELTAPKFVPHPASSRAGARLYLTGDLARFLATGEIEFLGRLDHQVKLRGFRIELGEIEEALTSHSEVRECVVVLRGSRQEMTAYLVAASGARPSVPGLRAYLRDRLPEYMVPATFEVLDALPLTPSGKVNRRALPEPARPAARPGPPVSMNRAEKQIAEIWCEVLGVEEVGRDESFFDLGGHSLLLLRLRAKLRERLQLELSVPEMFQYTSVRALARRLNPDEQADEPRRRAAGTGRLTEPDGEGIAVVGMAGRFPGARDLDQFWENLAQGVESIRIFTHDELTAAGVDPAVIADENYVKAKGFLEDAELFDAGFFRFSPREAEIMDPQHRVFLECAWQALENAGYDPPAIPGAVGVYGGMGLSGYALALVQDADLVRDMGVQQIALANDKDYLCTRVAYKLGLRGPAVTVQTACSTSLVAVHMACRALAAGECEMALAGGVAVTFPQKTGYLYEEHGILSRDGHCRAFDARANGSVGGEGVGIVVLKPLGRALADRDTIHAVVRGSALNNDGPEKVGFTAPSVSGQAAAIEAAHRAAGVEPATIRYVEAHGTGTELGDPIEIAALTEAFGASSDKSCAIGSVKTNVGHLDAAAGIAGLIKTILALEHGKVPPSLHFSAPNPEIDLERGPFYVNDRLADWPADATPRRAGVSSFGLGGTNVHVVLEEAPPPPSVDAAGWQLLPLSARTEPALEAATDNLARHLAAHPELELADVAHTLQVGRRPFEHRRVLMARDPQEAVRHLESRDPARMITLLTASEDPCVAFLFPGLGDHYPGMGYGLYQAVPAFRQHVDRCAEILEPRLGADLREVLFPEGAQLAETSEASEKLDLRGMMRRGSPAGRDPARLASTRFAQPALFVVEYALARYWMDLGVRPAALLGYSLGEYVAACLAGVLTLEDALVLVAERARMIDALPAGAMLAVALGEQQLGPYLAGGLDVSAVNGPEACVVGGTPELVEDLEQRLTSQGVSCLRLRTSHAFHSSTMQPIAEPLGRLVAAMELRPPQIAYLSNVTGTWADPADVTRPEYWIRHLLEPVRFGDAVQELWDEPSRILLEAGPGHALGSLALQALPAGGAPERPVFASMRQEYEREPDLAFALRTLGQLWLRGVEVDWSVLGADRRRVPLPSYPFERRPYLVELRQRPPASAAGGKKPDPADWFYVPSWKRSTHVPVDSREEPGRWWILGDGAGVGRRLAVILEGQGAEVVLVEAGQEFEQLAPRRCRLDPASPKSYERLLARAEQPPDFVVHLFTLAADPGESYELAEARGFYSLLYLAQTLGNTARDDTAGKTAILTLTDGLFAVERGDRVAARKATLLGPVRVVPQESANLICRAIDVDLRDLEADGLERLVAELCDRRAEPVVARRAENRWLPTAEAVRLEVGQGVPALLRPQGVYLITGGLGGIGLELAGFLARTVGAGLVLTSRTGRPGEQQRLRALEEAASEVLVIPADVTREEDMSRVAGEIRRRFGRLDGVFHAAGVPGGGLAQLKTREDASRVMAPKTLGTLVLERTLTDLGPRFFCHFSSNAALLGGIGQVDYCAANAFLGALAHGARAGKEPAVITVDWCEWQWNAWSGEMSRLDPRIRNALESGRREYGLAFEEGMDALMRILASGRRHVVVSTTDLEAQIAAPLSLPKILEEMEEATGAGQGAPGEDQGRHGPARDSLATPYVAPGDETERRLAAIWGDLLGVAEVGVHDNFFELGGHSLLGLRILARMRDAFRVELPLRSFFEAPTVSQLARVIQRTTQHDELPEIRTRRPDARRLLQNIDQLSDDEMEAVLAQMVSEKTQSRKTP